MFSSNDSSSKYFNIYIFQYVYTEFSLHMHTSSIIYTCAKIDA